MQPVPRSPWPSVLLAVGTVMAGGWIVVATLAVQGIVWFAGELVLATTGRAAPSIVWLIVAVGQTLLVTLPAGLLAILARAYVPEALAARAATRAWLLAGAAGGLLGVARAVPVQHNEAVLAVTAVLAGLAALGLARRPAVLGLAPQPAAGNAFGRTATGFGAAAGLAVLIPWAWFGALGGLTETLLAVIAAAAVGWLAATILDRAFFGAFAWSHVGQMLVGGLAAGVALVPLAAGLGHGALNLAALLALPPLGLAAGALASATTLLPRFPPGPWRATPGLPAVALTVLVGLGALGPLGFVDPEETSLILGLRDVGIWTLAAAVLSAAVGLVLGGVYGLTLRPGHTPPRWLPATVAGVVALAAGAVYVGAGQPGLYGDRLFVVMADQADLTGLDAIADRPARLRATYTRLVEHAERSQAALHESLDRFGLDYTPYYLVNGVLVDGGPAVRRWLSARSDVDRVLLDQRLRPLPAAAPVERGEAPAPDGRPQWNVTLIGADRVWRQLGTTGEGIVVGSSDSGVDGAHPALRQGFRGGDDSWYDPWNGTAAPTDHGGHGTHTMGTVEGRDGIGVAPGAQWIGCVNLDRNLGSPSRYLDCLQFMLAPFPHGGDPWHDGRPERAPHVLTNSWGCPDLEGCDLDSLRPATAALRAAGLFMVVAAGNTGPDCGSIDDPPAPYADVLTVGAVDRNRAVAEFSSRGPAGAGPTRKPDVVAPGVDVLSALPGGTYGANDGTSMATPHVAGVVALMWAAQPRLIGDVDTTARILRETSSPASVPPSVDRCGDPAFLTGAGVVDAYAAVRAARALR